MNELDRSKLERFQTDDFDSDEVFEKLTPDSSTTTIINSQCEPEEADVLEEGDEKYVQVLKRYFGFSSFRSLEDKTYTIARLKRLINI
jgi:hypothetical protein